MLVTLKNRISQRFDRKDSGTSGALGPAVGVAIDINLLRRDEEYSRLFLASRLPCPSDPVHERNRTVNQPGLPFLVQLLRFSYDFRNTVIIAAASLTS
jgi:hypothetical protein